MTDTPCTTRIARARLLTDRYPAAADILTFYAKLAEYQGRLVLEAPDTDVRREQLVAAVPAFLAWLERAAPAPLAKSVVELRKLDAADWFRSLDAVLAEAPADLVEGDEVTTFVVEALLQPSAERTARTGATPRAEFPPGGRAEGRCPTCRTLPVVGALLEEGHGARRALVCGRCATEWSYPRVVCPGCGEREFDALPVYTAEAFPHIRIDACDRCRRYLKTVDLSKDGLAVPVVDDLASLPLDLWAREKGYTRLRANLLRT